ncbi:HTH-type transcriptional repressor PurR [Streptomyces fumanus]
MDLLDGLNSLLHHHGLYMLLADARLNRRTGQDPAGPLTDLGVDGLVVVGTLPDPAALDAVAGRVPVVVAGAREAVPPGVDVVAGDDERGARLATEHLIGLGHRDIAHIAGYGEVGALRRRGFASAMAAHGLAGRAVVEPSDMTEEGGHRATVRLLARPGRPTAVFAVNDIACVGVLSAADELGLRVPRDLSVVGYDNTGLARLRHLWLTTVDSAGHEVGRRAARCLLDRLAAPGAAGERPAHRAHAGDPRHHGGALRGVRRPDTATDIVDDLVWLDLRSTGTHPGRAPCRNKPVRAPGSRPSGSPSGSCGRRSCAARWHRPSGWWRTSWPSSSV